MVSDVSSGKTAADENFPVGSWLLAPRLRPHVATFYAFARAADDIADTDRLGADTKVARLAAMAAALTTGAGDSPESPAALRMRDSLAATGVEPRHCLDLLDAFTQDATKLRYADWGELIDYCNRSAAPVGRYLLDLHGEARGGWPPADALCNALQVLNHLQDCQDDHRTLDRVYLPLDWLEGAGGTVGDLTRDRSTPAVRKTLDNCLDGVEALLVEARALPGALKSRRLAMESSVILRLARRLSARLRRGDPLAGRVALSGADFARCGILGAAAGLFAGETPAPPAVAARP